MRTETMLTLPEELLLLALSDDDGKILTSSWLTLYFGLAGAVLMELQIRKKIDISEDGVILVDETPTGDELLDEAIAAIGSWTEVHSLAFWLGHRPARLIPGLTELLLDRLIDRGIVRKKECRLFCIRFCTRYPATDDCYKQEVRERIQAVLLEGESPDERTALLLSLIHGCNLASVIFVGQDEKDMAKRLDRFAKKGPIAKTVSRYVALADEPVEIPTSPGPNV